MKRTALYSRSARDHSRSPIMQPEQTPAATPKPASRFKHFLQRFERPVMIFSGVVAALAALGIYSAVMQPPLKLTQRDIDAAVLHTLKKQPPEPSHAAVAYDIIRPSVVLVRRLGKHDPAEDAKNKSKKGKAAKPKAEKSKEKDSKKPEEQKSADKDGSKQPDIDKDELKGLGTGVVFSEDGMIFTNLHVIAGAEKIGVVFGDGTESEVEVMTVQPENDLAVLRAKTLPDDLVPATLRSTKGLHVGDEVLAVGFPFGIGPSATFGVVSGLRREHYSEEGQKNLIDLIQFDAAANPGNSGGPLVTTEGDVVGIVTSILNPTDEGFFVGIAFAVPIENAASAAGVSPF